MITKEKLIEVMLSAGVEIEADDIDPNATFEELGLDSLDVFNFFSEIDAELGVEIPDSDFDKLQTIKQIAAYINK